MKVSIVTICYNSADTIEDTIRSVLEQRYPNIEYIVVDGGSSDGTLETIAKYQDRIATVISEPDNGIYDAMNKGISVATGDVIGILNSDDFYDTDDMIGSLVQCFSDHADMLIGDALFVSKVDVCKKLRLVSGAKFSAWQLRFGWMPAHPATFVRRGVYETFGRYKTDFKIAADYDFFVRTLLVGNLETVHTSKVRVTMRDGGASTSGFRSTLVISSEIMRALRENGVYSNLLFIWSRLPLKFIIQVLFSRQH